MDIDKLIAVLLQNTMTSMCSRYRDFSDRFTSITDSSFVGFDITWINRMSYWNLNS